jgi:hypothetical protein
MPEAPAIHGEHAIEVLLQTITCWRAAVARSWRWRIAVARVVRDHFLKPLVHSCLIAAVQRHDACKGLLLQQQGVWQGRQQRGTVESKRRKCT